MGAASLKIARALTTYSTTTQLSSTYLILYGQRTTPRISAVSWALPARRRVSVITVSTLMAPIVAALATPTLPPQMASCRATTTGRSRSTSRLRSSRPVIQARYHLQRCRNCATGTMHRRCIVSRCAYSASGLHRTTSAFYPGGEILVIRSVHLH